jgi:ATP-dependent Clp protease protease subunit
MELTVKNELPSIKSWLCQGTFDEAMLTGFMNFYEQLRTGNDKEATIYINSHGGRVSVVNSMISIMEASGITFCTCALGEASSAALVLLVHGHRRYAGSRASMLFHEVSFGPCGKIDEVKESLADAKKVNSRLVYDFASKTKRSAAWWLEQANRKASKDFTFNATAALRYGVVDQLGIPKLEITRRVI